MVLVLERVEVKEEARRSSERKLADVSVREC